MSLQYQNTQHWHNTTSSFWRDFVSQLVCWHSTSMACYHKCKCLLHMQHPSVNADVSLQAGICAVGISSVLSGQGSASAEVTQSQILLGMALIVCSQVSICLSDSIPTEISCRQFLLVRCCCCCVLHHPVERPAVILSLIAVLCCAVLCCAVLFFFNWRFIIHDGVDRLSRHPGWRLQGVQAAQVTVEDYGEGP